VLTRCPNDLRDALTGPCPSLRTPFTADGGLDEPGVRDQLDFMLSHGARCVILTYGDSLFTVLSDAEIERLTELVVRHVDRRAVVVAATGAWWTGKTAAFAQWCADIGADMLMVLPPDWAGSCTCERLVAHYRAAAEHLPVMAVTNFLLPRPPAFRRSLIEALLREPSGVVAFKDDVGDSFARQLCMLTHDRCAVIAGGQKQSHMNMLPYGVDGYFSVHLSFEPRVAWGYWAAVRSGDLLHARTIIRDIDMPLFDHAVAHRGGFSAVFHGLMELAGVCSRHRRAPYHTLDDAEMEQLGRHFKASRERIDAALARGTTT